MKLLVMSDLHTEFAPPYLPLVAADVVIMAGDIGIGTRGLDFVLKNFTDTPVIYVAGNHEFYGQSLDRHIATLRKRADGTNVHVLENECVQIGHVRFLGCTLWSGFDLHGDGADALEAMQHARVRMSDYSSIFGTDRIPVTPDIIRDIHLRSRAWLTGMLCEPFTGATVVVTHHLPSEQSLPPDNETAVAPAYASNLNILLDTFPISLWIHGHSHYNVDYRHGGTRIVSNQRGYPHDLCPGFRADAVVDV